MKIMHLRSSGGFFGAEGVILNLANGLNKLGFDNHIVCINNVKNPHVELLAEAQKLGIKTESVSCKASIDTKAIFHIRRTIRENKIDILHTHDYKANFFGWMATLFLPVKRVATNHLWTGETIALRVYELIDGFLLNCFDKIVAVSDKIAEDCRKFLLNKGKLKIIYNGIDLNKYSLQSPSLKIFAELGLPKNSKVVGAVGRLTPQKGFNFLIEAAKQVLDGNPNVIFLIIGDGPCREALLKQAKALNVDKKVIFTGIRTDMGNMYNLMDIFVLSSLSEGLPLVVLEAMAMQKPVIATTVGSVPKLVYNEQTGLLVNAKDPQSLASGIVSLLNDKPKAEFLAAQGKKLVEEKFSSTGMIQQYKEIYEALLKP
jgi:glycosyltransferase involved in cell wall biosynthesis